MNGYGFDVAVAPTVTAGAYSAGDIMGGLLTFEIPSAPNGGHILITDIEITLKAAVTPSLQAVIFKADPAATTKTDNAAYSLHANDAFKVVRSLPINSLGGYLVDHGTPNTISLAGINLVMKMDGATRKFYMLLIDLTGVTLVATTDLQVAVRGTGI
jgi:hypothetical protein